MREESIKKGYNQVNLGQNEDQISLHSMKIESFLGKKKSKKIQEAHSARIPHEMCLNKPWRLPVTCEPT